MGLLGNQTVLNLNNSWGSFSNGTATAGAYAGNLKQNFAKDAAWFGYYELGASSNQSIPVGYDYTSAFFPAVKEGGIAATERISGRGVIVATALRVRLSQSTINGVASITASLASLTPAAATIVSSGAVTAAITAISKAQASLAGVGSISANLISRVPLAASIVGVGSLTPNLKGVGRLEAEITSVTALSPQGLAEALLENNDIETGYNLKEALRLILASVAGKLSGAETTTITIRNVPDSKNRIVATVDSNGNRTAVTYDVGD